MQEWRDFYVFAGTAAATLMGLMFVVISLGQRLLATQEGSRATRAFFTPIVVFFTTVIVVSMLMLMPATGTTALGALLMSVAVTGIVYMAASGVHHVWRTSELGFDDFIWYVALPYASYFITGASAIGIWKAASFGLYSAASAILLLLLIAIRNAWDLVIYNIQRGGD